MREKREKKKALKRKSEVVQTKLGRMSKAAMAGDEEGQRRGEKIKRGLSRASEGRKLKIRRRRRRTVDTKSKKERGKKKQKRTATATEQKTEGGVRVKKIQPNTAKGSNQDKAMRKKRGRVKQGRKREEEERDERGRKGL